MQRLRCYCRYSNQILHSSHSQALGTLTNTQYTQASTVRLQVPQRRPGGFASGVAADNAATMLPAALAFDLVGGGAGGGGHGGVSGGAIPGAISEVESCAIKAIIARRMDVRNTGPGGLFTVVRLTTATDGPSRRHDTPMMSAWPGSFGSSPAALKPCGNRPPVVFSTGGKPGMLISVHLECPSE